MDFLLGAGESIAAQVLILQFFSDFVRFNVQYSDLELLLND